MLYFVLHFLLNHLIEKEKERAAGIAPALSRLSRPRRRKQSTGLFSSAPLPPFRFPCLCKNQEKAQKRRSLILVDAAGIEPASENPLIKLSTSVFSLLDFPLETPTDRLFSR